MIGSPILELQRVDSTNVYANSLLEKADLNEGTVIWAHEQFDGKGQNSNKWESEAGKNLTFTIILKPVFLRPDRQFLLTKAISLGVLDFIRNSMRMSDPDNTSERADRSPHGVDAGETVFCIKWPNDIFITKHKIAGILIENKIFGNCLEVSVVGIGVNINQSVFNHSTPYPMSMIHLLHREIELKAALQSACRSIDHWYSILREGFISELDLAYNRHLLGFEEWRNFVSHGSIVEGKITGVDPLGRLLITTRDEQLMAYNHKEIEYLL